MPEAETAVPQEPSAPGARCFRCGLDKLSDELVGISGRRSTVCKTCNSTGAILTKHGLKLSELLHEGNMMQFFRDCHKDKLDNGHLSYTRLRDMVKKSMIARHTTQVTESSSGSYYPLCYYEKQGYSPALLDKIRLLGKQKEHPLLGTTYQVSIDTVTTAEITETVEQQLLEREEKLRAKRPGKAQKLDFQDLPPLQEGDQEILDELSSHEDTPPASKKRCAGKKAGASKEDAAARRAAEKAERQAKQQARQKAALASRCVGLLKTTCTKLMDQQPKLAGADLDALTVEGLKDAEVTLTRWLHQSLAFVNGASGDLPLEYGSAKDVQAKCRAATQLLSVAASARRATMTDKPKRAKAKAKSKADKQGSLAVDPAHPAD